MNKKKEVLARMNKYLDNKPKYDKAFIVVYGGMLALQDYIEEANEVMPELFPNNLKYTTEDFLNLLYKNGADIKVSEEHNDIAELFRDLINNIGHEDNIFLPLEANGKV